MSAVYSQIHKSITTNNANKRLPSKFACLDIFLWAIQPGNPLLKLLLGGRLATSHTLHDGYK